MDRRDADARPAYDKGETQMSLTRSPLARAFATQALATTRPYRSKRDAELRVLDVGCGYGATAAALSEVCARVIGLEPTRELAAEAIALCDTHGRLEIQHADFTDWDSDERFDLVVLDNVYEHIADHAAVCRQIERYLDDGGVVYVVVPNRLWPIEVHYGLPFLSYLPLPLANAYLTLTRRGSDYEDASHAPTYWSIRRDFSRTRIRIRFVLPADLSLTEKGASLVYRIGAFVLGRVPALWPISKAFVVAGKQE